MVVFGACLSRFYFHSFKTYFQRVNDSLVVGLVAPAVVVLIRTTSVGNTGVEARRNALRNSLIESLGVGVGHC